MPPAVPQAPANDHRIFAGIDLSYRPPSTDVRPSWRHADPTGHLRRTRPSDLTGSITRAEALGRAFIDQGITFSLSRPERPVPPLTWCRGSSRPPVVPARTGHHPAGQGPRMVPSTTSTATRRSCATGRHRADDRDVLRHFHRQAAVINPAQRCASTWPVIDLVRDAQGHLPRPGGQPALTVRRLLRDGESAGDDPGIPEPVGTHRVRWSTTPPICCGRCATPRPPTVDPTVVVLTPGPFPLRR